MSRPYLFLRERLDRFASRVADRWKNRGRRLRWVARIAGLLVTALALTQLVPTLADESTPPPNEFVLPEEVLESDSAIVVSSSEDLSESGGDNSPALVESDSEITYATLETETVTQPPPPPPIGAASNQYMEFRIPSVIKVDPRSFTALMPALNVTGDGDLLLCISGGGLRFDALTKGFVDDRVEDEFLVEGDLTGLLRISAPYPIAVALLNAADGLRIWSNSGGLSGKLVQITAVAMTGLSTDPDFCGQGNTRYVAIQALGLALNTKKGGVRLR